MPAPSAASGPRLTRGRAGPLGPICLESRGCKALERHVTRTLLPLTRKTRRYLLAGMLAFIIRRVGQSLLVLLIVGLVAFSMFNFVGDPIDNMLGQERTAEDIARLREQLGLDRSFFVQYFRFLQEALQGNFGVSYRQGRPVTDILLERAPETLELAAVSGEIGRASCRERV